LANVNQDLDRFSEVVLQVVAGQRLMESEIEIGPEMVQKQSNCAATLA
jgi:hypothetical protein